MKSVLLNYAKKCSSKDYFNGVVYDRDLNMSVFKEGKKFVPFIEAAAVNMAVMTKTEAAREKDDTLSMIMATETKTLSQRETDDQYPYNY